MGTTVLVKRGDFVRCKLCDKPSPFLKRAGDDHKYCCWRCLKASHEKQKDLRRPGRVIRS